MTTVVRTLHNVNGGFGGRMGLDTVLSCGNQHGRFMPRVLIQNKTSEEKKSSRESKRRAVLWFTGTAWTVFLTEVDCEKRKLV